MDRILHAVIRADADVFGGGLAACQANGHFWASSARQIHQLGDEFLV